MTANPIFQEFYQQSMATVEEGANWTVYCAQLANLPTASGQPTLRTGYPSKFTADTNATNSFTFGCLYVVDHYLGAGSPNWQNTSYPGGLWMRLRPLTSLASTTLADFGD